VLVFALLHTVCDVGLTDMIGVGFTLIVNVCTGPRQALACGVTVNTPLVGAVPVLVAVNEAMLLPLPLAPMPIVVLLLAQVKVVPVTLLVNNSVLVFALLHIVCDVGLTDMIGVGFTLIVKVVEAPVHP
jgi:hypothetical protein